MECHHLLYELFCHRFQWISLQDMGDFRRFGVQKGSGTQVVCLLAQFRRLKGRPDEQKLILEALSTDFTLEYEFLTVISEAFERP